MNGTEKSGLLCFRHLSDGENQTNVTASRSMYIYALDKLFAVKPVRLEQPVIYLHFAAQSDKPSRISFRAQRSLSSLGFGMIVLRSCWHRSEQ